VIVAELLGHARLETTRAYSRPTQQDAINALELLDVDRWRPLAAGDVLRCGSTLQGLSRDYRPPRRRATGYWPFQAYLGCTPSLERRSNDSIPVARSVLPSGRGIRNTRLAADPDDRRAREEALSDPDGLEAPWPS
jgi:hypothetical protein